MEFEDVFYNTSDYKLTSKELCQNSFGKALLMSKWNNNEPDASKIINVQNKKEFVE